MKITDIKELEEIARKVRVGIIESTYNAKSGHPGGSLSVADILTVLYFNQMNIDEKNPTAKERDRLVLSKGHTSPALYSALALRGFFDIEELKTFRKVDSRLQGHPDMNKVPGVDASTGSLRTRSINCKWNGNGIKARWRRCKSLLYLRGWRDTRRTDLGSCNDSSTL